MIEATTAIGVSSPVATLATGFVVEVVSVSGFVSGTTSEADL